MSLEASWRSWQRGTWADSSTGIVAGLFGSDVFLLLLIRASLQVVVQLLMSGLHGCASLSEAAGKLSAGLAVAQQPTENGSNTLDKTSPTHN